MTPTCSSLSCVSWGLSGCRCGRAPCWCSRHWAVSVGGVLVLSCPVSPEAGGRQEPGCLGASWESGRSEVGRSEVVALGCGGGAGPGFGVQRRRLSSFPLPQAMRRIEGLLLYGVRPWRGWFICPPAAEQAGSRRATRYQPLGKNSKQRKKSRCRVTAKAGPPSRMLGHSARPARRGVCSVLREVLPAPKTAAWGR